MTNPLVTEGELELLVRCADRIIPGMNGWPSPSSAGIETFFRRVLINEDDVLRVRRVLSDLESVTAKALELAGPAEYDAGLAALESEYPLSFRVLLEFVYFGYYSRPKAVESLNTILGCDYVSPPQPFGYELDGSQDPTPSGRGTFIPTDQVVRVDLSKLESADAPEIAQGANPRFGNSATLFT